MTDKIKIHLEDHGQDFLWFIVDGTKVIEAGPFQNWLWAGKTLVPPKKWRRGSRVVWDNGTTLHYPVRRAEVLS
jgi:hypothetical protein